MQIETILRVKEKFFIFAIFIFCFYLSGWAQTNSPDFIYRDLGIASIWTGNNPANEQKEPIRVIQGYMNWDDFEKQRGVYNWAKLDDVLHRAESLNKPLVLQINAKIPDWMKNYVPYMGFSTRSAGYPAYQFYHPEYIKIYKELIAAFAERLNSDTRKHLVAGVRIQNNSFNTEAWNWEYNNNEVWNTGLRVLGGNPDEPSNWPAQRTGVTIHYPVMKKGEKFIGVEYLKEIITAYKEAFHSRGIRTFVRTELTSNLSSWFNQNYWNDPLSGALVTNFGMWWLGSNVLNELKNLTENQGVVSYVEDTKGSSLIYNARFPSIEKEIYWRQLIKLYMKVTYAATYGEDLSQSEKPAWKESFEMVNRYAGLYNKPGESSGAFLVWCYYGGKANINNISYFLTQKSGSMVNRTNIGSNNIPYGHNAKVLDSESVELGLNADFARKTAGKNIQIRVTYYKQANNDWDLYLHNGKSLVKLTQRETIVGNWNVDVFNVSDFIVPGNGQNDVVIKKTGTVNPIFHKIEILLNDNLEQKKNPFATLTIPGIIEAEHYDFGGEGLSYHDDTIREGNTIFRENDKVDLVLIDSATQQYAVGYINTGEWLEYSISSFTNGIYDISLHYSSESIPTGAIKLELNGDSLLTFNGLQNTTSFSNYQSITLNDVFLNNAGNGILRIISLGDGFSIDKLQFDLKSAFIAVEQIFMDGCSSTNIDVSETLHLDYVIMPRDATDTTVFWTSSDTTVAIVNNNGLVIAKSGGVTTISVVSSDGGFAANCILKVNNASSFNSMDMNNLKVYPNPASGVFNLLLKQNSHVTVFDIEGNVVYQNNQLQPGLTIVNLSGNNSGIYILRVNGHHQKISINN